MDLHRNDCRKRGLWDKKRGARNIPNSHIVTRQYRVTTLSLAATAREGLPDASMGLVTDRSVAGELLYGSSGARMVAL